MVSLEDYVKQNIPSGAAGIYFYSKAHSTGKTNRRGFGINKLKGCIQKRILFRTPQHVVSFIGKQHSEQDKQRIQQII